MYRACIFCSAPLGWNEAIERFPVGRSLAFDAEKGRLWAVCGTCARWNLAPLQERWEAIENAERLFRDTRTRVQRENIGLARLRDGTRLIRVGDALPGELAVWRYGESLVRRRLRYMAVYGMMTLVGAGGFLAGFAGAGISGSFAWLFYRGVLSLWGKQREQRAVHSLSAADTPDGSAVTVHGGHLTGAHLVLSGDGIGIHFPTLGEREERVGTSSIIRIHQAPLTISAGPARMLLGRAMVYVNEQGARRPWLHAAAEQIAAAGSPERYLRTAAGDERPLLREEDSPAARVEGLALEMALHEETERRALQGELAMLEGMWRQAEEIAAIADRLPDLPAPEPPRLAKI